jgi:protein involved in polysaccharide export with SLBB domain
VNVTGCGPSVSSPEEVAIFKKAGPIERTTGAKQSAKKRRGPYRVIPGDVLEFQLPTHMRFVSTELSEWMRPSYGRRQIEPYLVRVNDTGAVTMPIVGDIPVDGRSLTEIERAVIDAYYPMYVVNPPPLVCQVKNYQADHERVFTVMGLVNKPNAYPYPADVQYNLMEALAFAGGLNMIADPEFVKVYRQDVDGEIHDATFRIRDKAFREAYDVMIKPGDVIVVDHTLSTRINKFVSDIFRVSVGADARYSQF